MKKLRCTMPNCSKAYTSRFTLRRHLEAFHLRTTRFACAQCPKSFAYRHTLRHHMAREHVLQPMTIPLLTDLLVYSKDDYLRPSSALEPDESFHSSLGLN